MDYHSRFLLKTCFACVTFLISTMAMAHSYESSYAPCPVNYFDTPYTKSNGTTVDPQGGQSIDSEFDAGATQITHCLKERQEAKVVVAINGAHPSNKAGVTQTDKARFLSNIEYMRENYEVVHGMKIGDDIKIKAVASSHGALLMTTEHPAWKRDKVNDTDPTCLGNETKFAGKTCTNPFRRLVEKGMSYGVKFYVCQMASRVLGINMDNKIPGVKFVPGGHIAVADFQLTGHALIDL